MRLAQNVMLFLWANVPAIDAIIAACPHRPTVPPIKATTTTTRIRITTTKTDSNNIYVCNDVEHYSCCRCRRDHHCHRHLGVCNKTLHVYSSVFSFQCLNVAHQTIKFCTMPRLFFSLRPSIEIHRRIVYFRCTSSIKEGRLSGKTFCSSVSGI